MSNPLVTLAFLSWNRLYYLRATLESARRCIGMEGAEWIVSDNDSKEPGLKDYLTSLDWLSELWISKQSHAAAMNEIVSKARGKYLLLWPDDVQFVVEGRWLERLIATLEVNPQIGSLGLNFLRRQTVRRLFGTAGKRDIVPVLSDLKRLRLRIPKKISGPEPLCTAGWRLPGVIASGIPSLTRIEHWKSLGPWKTAEAGTSNLIDSSLGAEDFMIQQFQNSGYAWQQAVLMRPVAADIINDDTGCKAKVRGGRRYGNYTPPSSGQLYYEIKSEDSIPTDDAGLPLAFEDWVTPLGFQLPMDAAGNLLKASINTSQVHEVEVG